MCARCTSLRLSNVMPTTSTARTIAIDGREISLNTAGKGRYITELVRYLALIDTTNHYLIYITHPLPFPVPATITTVPVTGPPLARQYTMVHDAKRHGATVFFAPTAYLPALLSPLPVVLTIHDLALFIAKESRPALRTVIAEKLLLRRAAKKARHILAVSESTKRDVVNIFGIP